MLIDNSYFIGEIHIAGKGSQITRDLIDAFITKYEPLYLRGALGYSFSKLFADGLSEDSVDDRWNKLKSGDDYTDASGNLKHWDGLCNDMFLSPIANYIYYWFTRNNASNTTISGEKEDQAQGSINVSGAIKMARAWNEMVRMNCTLHEYLICKEDNGQQLFPEFDGCVDRNFFTRINICNL